MKKLQIAILAISLTAAMSASATLTWNMGNTGDYYASGSATVSGGQGTVTAQTVDEASILAKINTQASPLFKVGDITGGGYTINSFSTASPGTPSIVYGSLYLSPSGGSGSDVLILLSPMTVTGSGTLTYTFDLNTHADYRTMTGSGWSAYDPTKSGTFGDVIGMLSANADYAAFFGPQIGMSGTSDTAFNVSQIQLQLVPEPTTMVAGALLLLPFGVSTFRVLRRKQTA